MQIMLKPSAKVGGSINYGNYILHLFVFIAALNSDGQESQNTVEEDSPACASANSTVTVGTDAQCPPEKIPRLSEE